MRIALVAIGNEILSGSTLDTNSQRLSKKLFSAGYEVHEHLVLPDDEALLENELKQLLNRFDLVITMGGLGPTFDDMTRRVVAKVMKCGFRLDEAIERDLLERFGKGLASLRDQATVPEIATALPNPLGTAPGIYFDEGLLLLPGVPPQLDAIVDKWVMPLLSQKYPIQTPILEKSFYLKSLNENEIDPVLRKMQEKFPLNQFGLYPSYGYLAIRVRGSEVERPAAAIREQFKHEIYSEEMPEIEMALHKAMIEKKQTLSLAESCTGGAFSARLTKIPDASMYFMGGVVSYSNAAKADVLGVTSVEVHGAVSEETVREMAIGALEKFHTDWAVAISGIAGPSGGTADKPVGTIWFAIANKHGVTCDLVPTRTNFSRQIMIDFTINYVMARLLEQL